MQLSEIDRKIIANVHSLPLDEQQAILKYTLLLKENRKNKYVKNKTSFSSKLQAFLKEVELEPLDIDTSNSLAEASSAGEALKAFLKKYEADPIDIDTSIFDSYRKSVKDRDFRWED
jgi:hypothetical protein